MRVALLYPPPWKIARPGDPRFPPGEGPPSEYREGDLDPDFHQIPYGLLSLAAQATRDGHEVKVLNLSSYPWLDVERIVRELSAQLFGMSCWTANRRGVAYLADSIRAAHPTAHVVVGGPHATPLAREMLRHHPSIDSVVLGEGELTFRELLARLASGSALDGLAGLARRDGTRLVVGPTRPALQDLDTLAMPQDYFDTHVLMTARGCPWACTFCGAETTWGRGFRSHSVGRVLDALERSVSRLPVKMIQIKDDTFTTNKRRVVEICRGIRQRKLQFLWSCDTRADLLTEEVVREMRLAGCERLSLGVETGSAEILKNIDKKITVEEILESTELAKRYGIHVRYYMMLGNRGETERTFEETLDFLARARPHEYIFSCLSIYPGTRDFQEAEQAGWLDRDVFFSGDFQELKTPFDASPEDTQLMNQWFVQNRGIRRCFRPDIAELEAVLGRLGEHHAAHLDLARAFYESGDWQRAETHARRALELGYPLPGIVFNYLACLACARGDYDGMMSAFSEAARIDPQHAILIQNVNRARAWFRAGGPRSGVRLELDAHHEFMLLEKTLQPTLPGPLAPNYAQWEPCQAAAHANSP